MVHAAHVAIIPLQSNEWTFPVEGVKLNLPQILEAEGDFLVHGLTISPRASSFSSNKTRSTKS